MVGWTNQRGLCGALKPSTSFLHEVLDLSSQVVSSLQRSTDGQKLRADGVDVLSKVVALDKRLAEAVILKLGGLSPSSN